MKKYFNVKMLVATAIAAALFFVLGRFVAIPSGIPNTNISIQYGVLAFVSAIYGPIAGLLAGFIGHFFIDFSYGWGVWYSWVIASAFFGCAMGFVSYALKVDNGDFNVKKALLFNAAQIIANLLAWGVIAPVLDIVIYAEDATKVFVQGLVAGGVNMVACAVIGTLLLFVYAKAIPKKGSLKEEL